MATPMSDNSSRNAWHRPGPALDGVASRLAKGSRVTAAASRNFKKPAICLATSRSSAWVGSAANAGAAHTRAAGTAANNQRESTERGITGILPMGGSSTQGRSPAEAIDQLLVRRDGVFQRLPGRPGHGSPFEQRGQAEAPHHQTVRA